MFFKKLCNIISNTFTYIDFTLFHRGDQEHQVFQIEHQPLTSTELVLSLYIVWKLVHVTVQSLDESDLDRMKRQQKQDVLYIKGLKESMCHY